MGEFVPFWSNSLPAGLGGDHALFSFSWTGEVEWEWFENLLPTGDDSTGLSGMTSSKSQSSKSWKPCTAAGVVLTAFKGAGKSPREASDFDAEISSSKSFCE